MNNITTLQSTIPVEAAQTLSHLANLIDTGLKVRAAAESPRAFAARHLGVPLTDVAAEERSADYYEFFAVGRAGVEFMDKSIVSATMGYTSDMPPTWGSVGSGDTALRHPVSLFAAVKNPRFRAPLVLGFMKGYQGRTVSVFHRAADERLGTQVLEHLWKRSSRVANPFNGAVVSVTGGRGRPLEVRVTSHRPLARSSVYLPKRVWNELDLNVGGLLDHYKKLAKRGLGATRGVLLHGPPGTGKTAAVRAIVTEQQHRATVVMCDAGAVTESMPEIMSLAADLAPSIVVVEDIDRLVSDQNHGFLVALDGVEIDRTGVVLIATANDVAAMGSATLRSARFDVKIKVPLPNVPTRRAILTHYLGGEFVGDLSRVVAATEGASGADLHEIVSAATLEAQALGEPVKAARLAEMARVRFRPATGGFYL